MYYNIDVVANQPNSMSFDVLPNDIVHNSLYLLENKRVKHCDSLSHFFTSQSEVMDKLLKAKSVRAQHTRCIIKKIPLYKYYIFNHPTQDIELTCLNSIS